MKIVQCVPTFFEGVVPKAAEFSSDEELLAVPWVQHWAEDSKDFGRFHRFSVTLDGNLMVEYNQGRKWWTIGHIRGGTTNLPEWKPVR